MDRINPATLPPKPEPPIEPAIVQALIEVLRQHERLVEASKESLASYLARDTGGTCQYDRSTERTREVCTRRADGVVLISCGHFLHLCAEHGSRILRDTVNRNGLVCIGDSAYPDLHEGTVSVTLEWRSLA